MSCWTGMKHVQHELWPLLSQCCGWFHIWKWTWLNDLFIWFHFIMFQLSERKRNSWTHRCGCIHSEGLHCLDCLQQQVKSVKIQKQAWSSVLLGIVPLFSHWKQWIIWVLLQCECCIGALSKIISEPHTFLLCYLLSSSLRIPNSPAHHLSPAWRWLCWWRWSRAEEELSK